VLRSFAVALPTLHRNRVMLFKNWDDTEFALANEAAIATQSGTFGKILGAPQRVDIAYDANNHFLTVLLNGNSIGLDNVPLGAPLSQFVGGDTASFGITAGEGVIRSTVELFDFSAAPAIPGDANRDGAVNFSDFQALERGFGRPGGWAQGDFDGDGMVGHDDFTILYEYFGGTMSAGAMLSLPQFSGLGAEPGRKLRRRSWRYDAVRTLGEGLGLI
jgi:hypothetical protein